MGKIDERYYIQYLNSILEWTCVRGSTMHDSGKLWFIHFGNAHARMIREATQCPGVAHRVVVSRDKGATFEPVIGNGVPFSVSESVAQA